MILHLRAILLATTFLCSASLVGCGETASSDLKGHSAFFALSVADIDSMIQWYTKKLGFKVESQGGNSQRKGALLSKPGVLIEIAEFVDSKSLNNLEQNIESHQIHGIFKLGFIVPDIDAAFKTAQTNKMTIFFPIVQTDGKLRTFGVKDPEGNIVQFFGQ